MKDHFAKYLLVLVLIVLLQACAEQPRAILVTGEVLPEIKPNQVRLYYTDWPSCNFDTVGYINEDLAFSRHELMHRFKLHAAHVGAPAVMVISIQNLDGMEYLGTAKAIRCL